MKIEEVRTAILTGELDNHHDDIHQAIIERRKLQAMMLRGKLQPGDDVVLHGTRPQYLNGQKATIIRVRQTKAEVRFHNAEMTGRFGFQAVCPLTTLRKVEE